MRAPQCGDYFFLQLFREDRLEPQLRNPFLPPGLTQRRLRSLAAEEGAGSLRVPGAALVVADPPGARLEERVADDVERLARYEDDELAVQVPVSICAFCSLPL